MKFRNWPSVFTGSDLISWILKNLEVEDVTDALHLAYLLSSHGYLFPIDDHALTVKNDGTFYRFVKVEFNPQIVMSQQDSVNGTKRCIVYCFNKMVQSSAPDESRFFFVIFVLRASDI